MIAAASCRTKSAFAVRQPCHKPWRLWSTRTCRQQQLIDDDDRRLLSTMTSTTTPCSSSQFLYHHNAAISAAALQYRSPFASAPLPTRISHPAIHRHLHHQSSSSSLLSTWQPWSIRLFHCTSVIQDYKRHDNSNSDRRQRRRQPHGDGDSGRGDSDSKNAKNVDFDYYNRQTRVKKQLQQRRQQQQSEPPVGKRRRPIDQVKHGAYKSKWTSSSSSSNTNNNKTIITGRKKNPDLFERFDSRDVNKIARNPQQQQQQQQRRRHGRDDDEDSTFRHGRRPQENDEQQRRQLRKPYLSSSRQQAERQPPQRQPRLISSAVFMDDDDECYEDDSATKLTRRTSNRNSRLRSSSSPRDVSVGQLDNPTKSRSDRRREVASSSVATISRVDPSISNQETRQETPVAQKTRPQQRQRPALFPPHALDVFVSCLPGLEPVLGNELTLLGIPHKLVKNGANLILSANNNDNVKDSSSRMALLDCCLYLGSASQVLIRCGRPFPARALGELQRKVALMPWQDILLVVNQQQQQQQHAKKEKTHHDDGNDKDKDTAMLDIHVKVAASKSRLLHTTAIRDRVIEGIHASLSKKTRTMNGAVSSSGTNIATAAPIHLVVRVVQDRVLISIDATAGIPLHQRGYRLETGKAPLREDLAYAMLYSAGWTPPPPPSTMRGASSSRNNHNSNPYQALLDPLCGSGTIPIEAASMIAGLPPGRLRPPPLQGTTLYDPKAWKQLVAKALKQSTEYHQVKVKTKMISISASDRNEGVIEIVKSNAERAGVLDMLDIQHAALSVHPWLQNDDDDDEDINMANVLADNANADPFQTHPTTAALAADKSLLIATNLPFGRRLTGGPRKKSRTQQFLPLYQTLAARINGLLGARSVPQNNDEDEKHDDESDNHPVSKQPVVLAAMCLTNDPHLLHRSGCQLPSFQPKLSMSHGGILVSAMFASSQGPIGTGDRSDDAVQPAAAPVIVETQHEDELHYPATTSP